MPYFKAWKCKNYRKTTKRSVQIPGCAKRIKRTISNAIPLSRFSPQVCSRLAYECLVTVKRGISSPKFVETDPHFGLLTRAIQYLDREMRGNYRNLICVRYEVRKTIARVCVGKQSWGKNFVTCD